MVASGFGEAYGRGWVSGLTPLEAGLTALRGARRSGLWYLVLCIYLDCPGPGLLRAPCHGTRPHAGLRDLKKTKKNKRYLTCNYVFTRSMTKGKPCQTLEKQWQE